MYYKIDWTTEQWTWNTHMYVTDYFTGTSGHTDYTTSRDVMFTKLNRQ